MEFLYLIFFVAIAVGIWAVSTYNKLQAGKQSIVEQASNMQVSMQKRRDLAERILSIAQGFGDHEKLTHLKVSSNQSASSESLAALSQSFPELKANETYLQSMRQLEELETNIAAKREAYNRTVKHYNTYRSGFPTMLVANKLKFEQAPYYDASTEDSLEKLATFTRDDADAVRELLTSSSASLKKTAKELKNAAAVKLDDLSQSGAVKTVMNNVSATGKVEVATPKAEAVATHADNDEVVIEPAEVASAQAEVSSPQQVQVDVQENVAVNDAATPAEKTA